MSEEVDFDALAAEVDGLTGGRVKYLCTFRPGDGQTRVVFPTTMCYGYDGAIKYLSEVKASYLKKAQVAARAKAVE